MREEKGERKELKEGKEKIKKRGEKLERKEVKEGKEKRTERRERRAG